MKRAAASTPHAPEPAPRSRSLTGSRRVYPGTTQKRRAESKNSWLVDLFAPLPNWLRGLAILAA